MAYAWSDGKTDLLALVDSAGSRWPAQLTRGFRKSETIVDYLQETERFLQIHVLFAA